MQQLYVALDERSYPIYVGSGLLADPGLLAGHVRSGQVLVVSNEVVAPLYLESVVAAFGHCQVDTCVLPDGEQYKTLAVWSLIFDSLLAGRHARDTTLVALGGGVVGDMTGFAAACYQRGVDFLQIPTTLLAQVDSSVGGKTAVNHPAGKNMIGAFHQPRAVFADVDTLNTLPDREFHAGVAEVIKYGLIVDPEFFTWLEAHAQQLQARDVATLCEVIMRSCENKAQVVAEDERETGRRAILNLGHTFGHAIETHQSYGQWLHGEAVAAGMVMACELSARLGLIDGALTERLVALLRVFALPLGAPTEMSASRFLELMAVDKKVVDGRLRLVVLDRLGHAEVKGDVSSHDLEWAIEASRRFT